MHHSSDEQVLEVNYCHKGIIGWDMKDNTSVYLNPGDLEVHTLDCCSSSTIHLPLGHYEGVTVLIQPFQLDIYLQNLFKEWNYDPHCLIPSLCPSGEPLSLSASLLISSVFSALYEIPEHNLCHYARLKTQELLFFLALLKQPSVPRPAEGQ